MNRALDMPGNDPAKQTSMQQKWLQETSEAGHNPIRFIARKVARLFNKKQRNP
jgi:hypothetical protein